MFFSRCNCFPPLSRWHKKCALDSLQVLNSSWHMANDGNILYEPIIMYLKTMTILCLPDQQAAAATLQKKLYYKISA